MVVVVAMSGGVDSSVAAGLLAEQGHEVIGVHMKLHDTPGVAGSRACCGLDDALDARRVAAALDFPFYIWDLRQAFQKAVMDSFAASYRAGLTPNPCVLCNSVLKFDVLLARARALGADALATGHYARVDAAGGLRAASDADKDQSYFLFPVRREALATTLFPLGAMRKAEVRGHAARLGLVTADKPESQDICFLPQGDHAAFVAASTEADGAGEIVDETGVVLGRHDGYWRFTVGQRRGLGVSAPRPLYVLRVEPDARRVVVGPEERLAHHAIVAAGCNWFRRPSPDEPVAARIRHRGALLDCTVHIDADDRANIAFRAPARAATPGQAVVLYSGDEVLGGGWIREVAA